MAIFATPSDTQAPPSPVVGPNLPFGGGARFAGRIRVGIVFCRWRSDALRLWNSSGVVVLHGLDGVPLRQGGTNRRASRVDDPKFFTVARGGNLAALFAAHAFCDALAVFTRLRSDFVAVLGTESNFSGMDDSAALGRRSYLVRASQRPRFSIFLASGLCGHGAPLVFGAVLGLSPLGRLSFDHYFLKSMEQSRSTKSVVVERTG